MRKDCYSIIPVIRRKPHNRRAGVTGNQIWHSLKVVATMEGIIMDLVDQVSVHGLETVGNAMNQVIMDLNVLRHRKR